MKFGDIFYYSLYTEREFNARMKAKGGEYNNVRLFPPTKRKQAERLVGNLWFEFRMRLAMWIDPDAE